MTLTIGLWFLALHFLFFIFFFQAEDGIRDRDVTGVQTCALPIAALIDADVPALRKVMRVLIDRVVPRRDGQAKYNVEIEWTQVGQSLRAFVVAPRSEERRVGKECRGRWWALH